MYSIVKHTHTHTHTHIVLPSYYSRDVIDASLTSKQQATELQAPLLLTSYFSLLVLVGRYHRGPVLAHEADVWAVGSQVPQHSLQVVVLQRSVEHDT
jgi:hypothetical protein